MEKRVFKINVDKISPEQVEAYIQKVEMDLKRHSIAKILKVKEWLKRKEDEIYKKWYHENFPAPERLPEPTHAIQYSIVDGKIKSEFIELQLKSVEVKGEVKKLRVKKNG